MKLNHGKLKKYFENTLSTTLFDPFNVNLFIFRNFYFNVNYKI